MEYAKPESIRYNHDKVLFITFEANEDCHLQMAVYQNSLLDMERFKAAMRKPVADKKQNALSKVNSYAGSNTSHTITNASSKLLICNSQPASNTSLINSPRGLMLKRLDEMMGRDGVLGCSMLREN